MERRTFFKLIGISTAAAASGALVSCAPGQGISTLLGTAENQGEFRVANTSEVNFSSDVDVLIVGSGISGMSAAMAPAEAGHSVMIVEKLDLLGGESYLSNALMRVSGSALQKSAGITTTAIEAWDARKQELADAGVPDLEFAKRLFVTAPEWVDHISEVYKAQFADPQSYVSKGASASIMLPKNGIGDMESIMIPLRDGLLGEGVSFSTGMRAAAFIVDDTATICGMRLQVMATGATSDIRARRVVLATGGFASSQPMVHQYIPSQESIGCCTYASMGEGQLLCLAAGGQLADMEKPAPLIGDIPPVSVWGMFGPTMDIDPFGKRFAREDVTNAAANACYEQGLGFWWTVFDKQLADGVLSRNAAQVTSKYVKRMVGPFASIEELATALSITSDALKATFETYNKAVDEKKDATFGRTLFLQKLGGPYYAFKQFPVRYKTRGGGKTDGDGRLLNATGSAVPSVYCCGSTGSSSVEGLASNGTFGMLVGKALTKSLEEETTQAKQATQAKQTTQAKQAT